MLHQHFIKTLVLCSLLALGPPQGAHALRPYGKGAEAKASWMTVSSIKTGQEYYMEVAADGALLTRTATRDAIVTKRGKIAVQLVKDFFREIENSEIINSQGSSSSKMVFYKGEILKISAYITGELRLIVSPLNRFGEAFSYAFSEVKKASEKLADEHALKGFLTAEPLEGDQLEQLLMRASKDRELPTIETYDIQKIKPLMKAIKQPHRLIPLETADELEEIRSFIDTRQLYGLRKLFYLSSTRGTFKCQILDAEKAAPVKPPSADKSKASARKKARRRTPPGKN